MNSDNNHPGIVIVRLPKFKAISTEYHNSADENKLWALWGWMDEHENLLPSERPTPYGIDFVLTKNGMFSMICAVSDKATEADLAPYKCIEFVGGLYATAISHAGYCDSLTENDDNIMTWIESSNFLYDDTREIMGENINDDDEIQKGLGCYQFLKYVPIKLRS